MKYGVCRFHNCKTYEGRDRYVCYADNESGRQRTARRAFQLGRLYERVGSLLFPEERDGEASQIKALLRVTRILGIIENKMHLDEFGRRRK